MSAARCDMPFCKGTTVDFREPFSNRCARCLADEGLTRLLAREDQRRAGGAGTGDNERSATDG